MYYFNKKTKEVSWDPPPAESDDEDYEDDIVSDKIMEIETASTASEDDDADLDEEDGEDTDDEEEDDSEDGNAIASIAKAGGAVNEVVSDLSEQQKDALLRNSRKKSKEERQHERRQKREQNREKRCNCCEQGV